MTTSPKGARSFASWFGLPSDRYSPGARVPVDRRITLIAKVRRKLSGARRIRYERRLTEGGRSEIDQVQCRRLDDHVAFAREHSRFYAKRYAELPKHPVLTDLPVVTKGELLSAYDDWSTDPEVTWRAASDFVADPDQIGERFLGKYAVARSTGSTGSPSIHVRDRGWQRVYATLGQTRFSPRDGATRRSGRLKMAFLARTDSHFAMYSDWKASTRGLAPEVAASQRLFSLSIPIDVLVRQLNDFQPDIVSGPSSILDELAYRQSEGSLQIGPMQIQGGSEALSPESAAAIGVAFGCPVRDRYTTTEAKFIAFGCDRGWLHVNEDWVVLEPVDEDLNPVAPGVPSTAVLMTELANEVQPLIRYRMNDSVTVRPDACECGNPFLAVRVRGKNYQVLRFVGSGTSRGAIHSAALDAVIQGHGVERRRLSATETMLRVEVAMDGASPEVPAAALRELLDEHGLAFVEVAVVPFSGDEP